MESTINLPYIYLSDAVSFPHPLAEEFAPDEAATENAAAEIDEYASDSEGNDDATVSVETIRPADEITEDDEEIK